MIDSSLPGQRASGDVARGPIRVMIVAAEPLFVQGARRLLARKRGIEIVGGATRVASAMAIIRLRSPDVVLLDVTTAPDPTDVIQAIGEISQRSRILLLIGEADNAGRVSAFTAGVSGCVSKSASAGEVVAAIRASHRRRRWVTPPARAAVAGGAAPRGPAAAEAGNASSAPRLTVREREILALLMSGRTNRTIADTLLISEKTVKTHLNNIFRKLNVTRRLQAVLYAVRVGLRQP